MESLYLVDFENVGYSGLKGIDSLDSEDEVIIFCRKNDITRLKEFVKGEKNFKISYELVTHTTRNALDFELIASIGLLSDKQKLFIIISADKGYDAAIDTYLRSGIACGRKINIAEVGFETSFSELNQGKNRLFIC